MKVTWIGHACFRIEENGYAVVLDPYENGSVPGLANVDETAQLVLCSHEHGDHNARGNVKITEGADCPFTIDCVDTFHDDEQGAKRGPNRIHILTSLQDGKKAVHLGDLGCPLTEEQQEKLKDADVLMIPVGGFFTIDYSQAAEVVRQLNPKVVIPMHYRSDSFGFDVIDTVDRFTLTEDAVQECPYSTLDTDLDYAARIVVLKPQNQN